MRKVDVHGNDCPLSQKGYAVRFEALSSSWLGHGPLKAGARVRVPLGLVNNFKVRIATMVHFG